MATGDALCIWKPQDNEPPVTIYATFDVVVVTADTPSDAIAVLDFDDAADEYAVFSAVMPEHYSDATGVDIEIAWSSANTAAAKTCLWNVAFKQAASGGNLGTNTFAASVAFSAATDSTTADGVNYTTKSVPKASMDSVVKGDYFRIQIWRDISGDDLGGSDANLISVYMTET